MNEINAYDAYIASCKAPKDPKRINNIVREILHFMRKGLSTGDIANELNKKGVHTIQGKPWSYNALQMQLLKMAKNDPDSSLAWALFELIDVGEASLDDVCLIKDRTRTVH